MHIIQVGLFWLIFIILPLHNWPLPPENPSSVPEIVFWLILLLKSSFEISSFHFTIKSQGTPFQPTYRNFPHIQDTWMQATFGKFYSFSWCLGQLRWLWCKHIRENESCLLLLWSSCSTSDTTTSTRAGREVSQLYYVADPLLDLILRLA